jgi:hypothetical protein
MKSYNIILDGISPLLMNKANQFEISDKAKDVKRENRTPEDIAEKKLYMDSNGRIYLPSTWFRGSIVDAGKKKKRSGTGSAKSNFSGIVGSSVEISPFEIILENPRWKVFSILAVNPTTRGKNLLHRPQFDKWKVSFDVNFEEDQIEPSVMKEIFDIAGRFSGVGDWRPNKKGAYGKFQVVSWKENK